MPSNPAAAEPSRLRPLRVAGTALFPAILSELLAEEDSSRPSADPLAPRPPHFPARAKSVIFLFMSGGVSHVDSFDPKPRLVADHGKQIALDHPETRNRPGYEKLFLKRPQWEFAASRAERDRGQHALPAHGRLRRRPRRDPVDERRPLEPLQRDARDAHRLVQPGPAEHRVVGQLRARHDEPEPAVVHGHRPADALRRRRRSGRPTSCRGATRGRWSTPGPEPMRNVRPLIPADLQRRELDALAELNGDHLARSGHAPELEAADPQLRDRVRHAVGRPRGVRPRRRRPTRPWRSTAWSAGARRGSPGNAWSPGGWSSGASGSSS